MSYRGVLRGGAGDDPEPGDESETVDALDGVRTRDPDGRGAGGAGDGGDGDASEDDWEPVVTKGRRGAAPKRRGRRRDHEDDIDERVASLRI